MKYDIVMRSEDELVLTLDGEVIAYVERDRVLDVARLILATEPAPVPRHIDLVPMKYEPLDITCHDNRPLSDD